MSFAVNTTNNLQRLELTATSCKGYAANFIREDKTPDLLLQDPGESILCIHFLYCKIQNDPKLPKRLFSLLEIEADCSTSRQHGHYQALTFSMKFFVVVIVLNSVTPRFITCL